ncbi:hypothetical protein [Natrinema gari]|uniref:Uncharacterized protein n=1 Tax=Natrinema gari JCM 14663 TaxID=1230459 RepID=L9ZGD7_9EURY|nr:hypothetical protein [Natrinema gari]ELY85404.1 hypothetical protein C486_00145 [Natrinema gari JCM 14663]
MSESETTDHLSALDDADDALATARDALAAGDDQTAAHTLEQARETLANTIRGLDAGEDHSPVWELATDDFEDYVGCELVDLATSGFGTAAVLVFEREDGSLHGFKVTPRENVRVCDIEVNE